MRSEGTSRSGIDLTLEQISSIVFFSKRECFSDENKRRNIREINFIGLLLHATIRLLRSHPLCIGIYVYKLSIYATIYIGIST